MCVGRGWRVGWGDGPDTTVSLPSGKQVSQPALCSFCASGQVSLLPTSSFPLVLGHFTITL